jgi:hypothetical protein
MDLPHTLSASLTSQFFLPNEEIWSSILATMSQCPMGRPTIKDDKPSPIRRSLPTRAAEVRPHRDPADFTAITRQVPSGKRTTNTIATAWPIKTAVVGTPAANVVLMAQDTIMTRKSIKENSTMSDVASLVRTSMITITNVSTTELRMRMFAVLNMMLYTALPG